jgi:predicted dehydrogenase
MSKVRIGFVGVGGMGQCAHLRNYATLPECEVVACAEIRENLGKAVAAKYGIPKVYKNHEEMLANEKLDAIVASQPFNRHGVLLPDLYKAGIPIFTEKPLAQSIETGEMLLKSLKDSGAKHMVGYHKRSDPATMYAKAEIDRLKESGELGPMKYVRISMPSGDWIANGFFDMVCSDDPMPELVMDPAASDMDATTFNDYFIFVNYYIHQVNLMRHLLGEPYRVTYADASGVILNVQSKSGVAGIIEMTAYQTTVDWQESALVAFGKGYVKINLPAPVSINSPGTVEILRDPGEGAVPQTTVPSLPWVSAMRQQASNFISFAKGEAKPTCDAAEALEDLKVARDYIRLWKGK